MTSIDSKTTPWLTHKAVTAIFEALPEGSTRFVGGCVRNTLMGVEVGDIDLATKLKPNDVAAALDAAKIRYIPTGIEHGTLTAIIEGHPYEITSLRKDVETDGRRAVVAFTQDWAEDAQRRDLTINALYADISGAVFDPTGQGLDDLKAMKFRFVGNAEDRVKEDYLRILRFFRFLAWYGGKGKVDAQALKACRENRKGLKKLSAERVWSELKKMLLARDPSRAVGIMLTNEILDTLLPEASNADGLTRMVALERREAIEPDPLLRLMAMSAREPLQMALLCKRLKMSTKETKRLRGWADSSAALDPHAEEREKLKAIYLAGKQVVIDRARLRAAGEDDALLSSRWMSLADLAMGWTAPEFPLTGKDLKKAGVEPGPQMGKKLEALKALWVRSGFTADREKLLMALQLLNR
ncbi:CCA tRNA nucleotidyltransferase [Hellea balneolensis]|uniref:CCA tRNA nucleotidyltransferase n=1 Tax=Hellea balneolensis TaxID=287478 RepID=UPI0004221264|nr:CCA tRNA nucleotidyltransferase [Hellea balneolensis]